MVYSTPYIGNYICITFVMIETFLINGVYIGWSILTVRDSYTVSLYTVYQQCHFTTKPFLKQGYRDPELQQCSKKTTYSFLIQIVRNQRMQLKKSNLFPIVPIEGTKCLMI